MGVLNPYPTQEECDVTNKVQRRRPVMLLQQQRPKRATLSGVLLNGPIVVLPSKRRHHAWNVNPVRLPLASPLPTLFLDELIRQEVVGVKSGPHHHQDLLWKELTERTRLRQHGHIESREIRLPEVVSIVRRSSFPCVSTGQPQCILSSF